MPLGSNTKAYETPNHPFQGERIADEANLLGRYGLKNKEELWRAQSELRSFRREARRLIGQSQGQGEDVSDESERFLARLKRYDILGDSDVLDDVLSLDETDILERRLQTVVYRSGLANSPRQARQFISHGHIAIAGQRVTVPSKQVEANEESQVAFYETSPLADDLHPERADGQEQ
jgi:small subunit ribosomal protein S4